ncbi:MAG TPA: DNA-3-methyladenine glycosylase [Thermoplasmata archaeon]|nr:DNA-3-methyladenine glycosylase [Thermoplasmata archaeon]
MGRFSDGATVARLDRAFFDRPTVAVARDLLGATLRVAGRAVRIVETEAYVADDPASHAFRGPTARNRSMFGPPGTLYVYRIHQVVCANLVTHRGEAVLLRAGEPLSEDLENPCGPGRLCRALGIRLTDDGTSVVSDPRIRVERPRGLRTPIVSGPRVGIRRATRRRLRFALVDNPWVSSPRLPARAIRQSRFPRGADRRP